MKRPIKHILLSLALFAACTGASAQHTLGITGGFGMASARLDPMQEMKGIWGIYTGGISWRYYGPQRFVGSFGVDLEFIQQGYSFATNASLVDDTKEFLYYTRRMNTIMLPIVWQPHFYMARNRIRIFLEAGATFSYNLGSTYENEQAKAEGKSDWEGDYPNKTPRDNRWGYGLAGGGGVAFLINRVELSFRVRYYLGFSDVVKNRTIYADNGMDGSENPFWISPQRSPLDNLTFSIGVSYRFNKDGFSEWKPRPKRKKDKEVFKYGL